MQSIAGDLGRALPLGPRNGDGDERAAFAPGVQNREKSDLGAEVFGISGALQEGLGSSPKQQAVNQSLILQG